MRSAMFSVSCCSMRRFHSWTAGVFASACTPCGAKVVQGVGTPGPQEGAGCTPGAMGMTVGRETFEYDAAPL